MTEKQNLLGSHLKDRRAVDEKSRGERRDRGLPACSPDCSSSPASTPRP